MAKSPSTSKTASPKPATAASKPKAAPKSSAAKAVAEKTVAPKAAKPAAVKTAAVKPAAAKTPAPPAKASSPRSRVGTVVQVGATTSEAEARGLLSAMQARLGGREAWVEAASVDGKLWRRAVVGGFADSAEAARFCASLKAEGRGCFVRPSRPG